MILATNQTQHGSAVADDEQHESQEGKPLSQLTPHLLRSAEAPNHVEMASALILDHCADQMSLQLGDAQSEIMRREVQGMEQELEDALVKGDTAKLAQLLSDDITHGNPCGNLRGKAPWIAAVKASQLKIISFRNNDVQIRIYGETAVVTAINLLTALGTGSDPSGRYRFIHVWVKREGRWQLTAHQATRTAPGRRR
jgi:ketosteroid isomerase-like protein